jgi:transposase
MCIWQGVQSAMCTFQHLCLQTKADFFWCRVLSFIFYWFGMVRRKLTIPERWQAVGMNNDGFSHRRVADHFRVNHSTIVRLMQRFRQTGNVTDRPCAGRPRKTTPREDRLISRRARQRPSSTAGTLRGNLAFWGHISTRIVIRRLHHQGMRARRPIKRPQLTLRHRHARFDWSHAYLGWTISTWSRVHSSDESRFSLRPTDGRARVWRQRNTSFEDNHILGTTAFWGGGVTVWGCVFFDCKLDLYVLDRPKIPWQCARSTRSPPFWQSCVGWQANVHGRQR